MMVATILHKEVSVHRNEFGINGGLFPSPDGRYFAFYRNDQSEVSLTLS